MPGTPWTPVIVGGTDYGDGPLPGDKTINDDPGDYNLVEILDIEDEDDVFKFAESDPDVAVTISQKKLSEYASLIPANLSVTWDYGPIVRHSEGARMFEGQYVTETRDGVLYQTFWVPK